MSRSNSSLHTDAPNGGAPLSFDVRTHQMDSIDTSQANGRAIISRYKSIGFFGGLVLGSVVGIIVAGPHFEKWPAGRSLLTIFGSAGLGALVGYLAGEIALASEAFGRGSGIGGGSSSDRGTGNGSSGSGDSGGGDGDT